LVGDYALFMDKHTIIEPLTPSLKYQFFFLISVLQLKQSASEKLEINWIDFW
jgi:hypothetical protein